MNLKFHPNSILILFLIGSFVTIASSQNGVEWDKTYGGIIWEELACIQPTEDGGYLLGGFSSSPQEGDVSSAPKGGGDFWLVKINQSGQKLWDKRYGGPKLERIWHVVPTSDGGFLLAGDSDSDVSLPDKTDTLRGGTDYWVVKIDDAGNKQWDRTIGGAGNDYLRGGALQTADGGFLLAGLSDSDATGDKSENSFGRSDYWVVKLDASGQNIIWDRTLGGEDEAQPYALNYSPGGGYLVGGFAVSDVTGNKTVPLRGVSDYWLVKLDDDGTIIWDQAYGGDDEETLIDIFLSDDGNILLAGQSRSNAGFEKSEDSYGNLDYWVVKTDPEGKFLWDKAYGGDGLDVPHVIMQNEAGNFWIGGISGSDLSGNKDSPNNGTYDYWVLYLDEGTGEIQWQKSIGGSDNDAMTSMVPAREGGYLLGGHSKSNISSDKSENSKGMNDMWIVKLGCNAKIDLGRDTAICKGNGLELEFYESACDGCYYQWDDGYSEVSRQITLTDDATFAVTLIDEDGCESCDSIEIGVNRIPEILELTIESPRCFGDEYGGAIFVEEMEGGQSPYLYSLTGEYFLDIPGFENLNPGDYTVKVKDAFGCETDTTITMRMPEEFLVSLGEDIIVPLGDSVRIKAAPNKPAACVEWNLPNLLSCTECLDPFIKPLETITLKLTVQNEEGCLASDHISIGVQKDRKVFIPSGFSPDGDGINDFFYIYGGSDVVRISDMKIFDRWGQLLYEIQDAPPNATTSGWDGKFRGRPLSAGIFVYYAKIEFIDGRVEIFKGDLTLVR